MAIISAIIEKVKGMILWFATRPYGKQWPKSKWQPIPSASNTAWAMLPFSGCRLTCQSLPTLWIDSARFYSVAWKMWRYISQIKNDSSASWMQSCFWFYKDSKDFSLAPVWLREFMRGWGPLLARPSCSKTERMVIKGRPALWAGRIQRNRPGVSWHTTLVTKSRECFKTIKVTKPKYRQVKQRHENRQPSFHTG